VAVLLSARTTEQLTHKSRDLLSFLRECEQASMVVDLGALAYTLQVGREPMEERLGLLVSSVDELQSRLESYLAGEQGIEGLHRGQVKGNKDTLFWFETDADLQQTVQKWLTERKLPQLVDLWAKGLKVEWSRTYGERKPARISLPKYPFAKERYWRERPDAAPAALNPGAAGALHPLLHENVSTVRQLGYRSTFSGTQPLLAGWRLGGNPGGAARSMVAAVVFLEMARAAVELASASSQPSGQRTAIELVNVTWSDAVMLQDTQPMAVALFPKGLDELGYEIYSPDDDDVVHCQGRAVLRRKFLPTRLDLAGLRPRMEHGRLDARDHYDALARHGIEYAPAYQGIAAIHRGNRELLAEIDVRSAAGEGLVLNPMVLDGALQAASDLLSPANAPSLPLAVQSVRVLAPCTQQMVAWVRDSGEASGQGSGRVDVDLCDGQGNVCIEMRGVTYEAQSQPGVPALSLAQARVALHEPKAAVLAAGGSAKPRVALV